MMFGMEYLVMLFIILGQGGQDLLDFVSVDAYWKAKNVTVSVEQLQKDAGPDEKVEAVADLIKNLQSEEFPVREEARKKLLTMGPAAIEPLKAAQDSKDPEVAATAKDILTQLASHARDRQVRRLMAVRTLGERKEAAAVPLLKTLVDSKEPFVGEYAQRALAAIEGKAWTRPMAAKGLEADFNILPKDTGIVAQIRATPTGEKPVTIDAMVEEAVKNSPEAMKDRIAKGKDKVITKITSQVLEIADRVGNIRIDGLTLAVAQDVGPDKGWASFVARGQYDRTAVIEALETLAGGGPRFKKEVRDGVTVISMEREFSLAFVSDRQLVLSSAPNETLKTAALDGLLTALKTGKGGIAENSALAALMKDVDTKGMIWAAGILSDAIKKEIAFTGIDTFTLTTSREKDLIKFTLTGQGKDADVVASTIKVWSDGIQRMLQSAQKANTPKSLVEIVESLKASSDGTKALVTAQVKGNVNSSLVSPLMLYFISESEVMEPDDGGNLPAPGQ